VRVPADQPTIQAGVDAASSGDTVLVASGVYRGLGNRDIDILFKSLLVLSEDGSAATVIDCEGSPWARHRAFHLTGTDPSSTSVLIRGFTIRNGWVRKAGRGDLRQPVKLTIADCIIESCSVSTTPPYTPPHSGGGMYCSASSVLAVDCAFESNVVGSWEEGCGSGGGVGFEDCEGDLAP